MKVLIVDDEEHVVEGLRAVIPWKELGVSDVEYAFNGVQAWSLFQSFRPDLLITDIYMPKMNGLELIRNIRGVDPQLPVLILSGYDEFDYAKEAIDLNVVNYILKPAVHKEITEKLKETIQIMEVRQKQNRFKEEFQKQIDQNLPILREQYLFDMITFDGHQPEISKSNLEFYGIDPGILSGGLAVSLKIHRFSNEKTKTEWDWQLLKFAARNIAMETLEQTGKGIVLRYVDDRLVMFLFGEDCDETVSRAKIFSSRLIGNIGQYLDLNTNIGIGRWYASAEQYPYSEKESKEILTISEYEGCQKWFYAGEPRSFVTEKHNTEFVQRKIQEMIPCISYQDWKQLLNKWIEIERLFLADPEMTLIETRIMCGVMLNSVYLFLSSQEHYSIESQAELFNVTTSMHESDKESLMRQMREKWMRLIDYLEDKDNQLGVRDYVGYVKKRVQESYHENLSFTEMANELHMNRSYLSNLFKRETGKSFMRYLTEYRICKAKELMKSGRYMVYEVCEMVGYADPAYFSRVFKSVTGVSPTDYALGRSMNR